MSFSIRLLLAALSGVLAWLAGYAPIPLDGRLLLQGAVFGAFVLVPFLAPLKGWAGRAIALIAGGMAIQLMAAHLAMHLIARGLAFTLGGPGPSSGLRLPLAIPIAALAGALLVAALAQRVIPLHAPRRLWALAALAGLLGGLILNFPQALPGGRIPGLLAWQALVCAALHFGSGRRFRNS